MDDYALGNSEHDPWYFVVSWTPLPPPPQSCLSPSQMKDEDPLKCNVMEDLDGRWYIYLKELKEEEDGDEDEEEGNDEDCQMKD